MRVLLVVYENARFIQYFPQNVAAIAAVLEKEGFDVDIYAQDINHYPNDHLRQYLDDNHFDVLGLGVIAGYYQYKKLLELSAAVNASKDRPYYILGGHGPTPDPEYFLKKTSADAVIMGEGEVTIVELLKAVAERRPIKDVKGLAYLDGGKIHITPPRPQIDDLETLPLPAYHKFDIGHYRLSRLPRMAKTDLCMPVLSARGCTFKCTFCYRMDKGYRERNLDSLIDEIRFLQLTYNINYIMFSDELLMASVKRVEDICRVILKSGLKFKWWCQGRINYAKPDLLKLMAKAGCVFINYGIESMDDQVLKNMKKGLKSEWVEPAIEATTAAGISPGLNVLFGNIGDNRETLQKGVDLIKKHGDASQLRTIRPVTPYPGTPLYYTAIEKGQLKDCRDFYENKHTNSDLISVNFTNLTDDEYYDCLYDANNQLIEDYYAKQKAAMLKQTKALYHDKDATFRGFRQVG